MSQRVKMETESKPQQADTGPETVRASQWLLLEAAVLLGGVQLLSALCFRRIAPWMTRPQPVSSSTPPALLERRVSNAIERAARIVPWRCVCLPQAMAGKLMLALRGYPSTVRLGVSRATGVLQAHAWLEAGGTIVTGEDGMRTMTPFVR